MAWKGKQLSGDCQTNIVGPGFHGAVIHFLELFAARGELRLYVKDPTGYYADRDFERMTREYFYPWFKRLLSGMISNPRVLAGEPVCWPSDYFVPEPRNGMVMTHIRSFSIRELTGIVRSGLTAPFAKEFFIWNEEEKDAWYFRNCALVLLNQQCYFKPSSRSREDRLVNQEVLRLLEKALQMEPSIPFPEEEYLEVCRLDGHEPVDLSEVNRMVREEPIGCRRGLLYRTIGLMRFAVPGSFLYDMRAQGNSERYYDGESVGWHEYYICAVRTEDHEAAIRQEPFARETVERTESYEERGMQVKIAYYRPSRGNGYGAPRVERAVLIGEQLAWESAGEENASVLDGAGKEKDEAIRAFARAYFAFAAENKGLYRLIMSMPLNNDETKKEMAVPLLETVMELLCGYGLSREACSHWQRVLRAILHGFISQEDLGYFYYYKDTELEKSREIAIQCFLNGLHAETSRME